MVSVVYDAIDTRVLSFVFFSVDVNECAENLHTCHPSATCSNDKGGYKCECGDDTHPSCHSCVFQGTEVANGTTLAPPGRPCERCTCINGVMRCVEPACNCSLPSAARDKCCPQCDPALACNHQEFPQVVLMHGEKWSYQCQTCECLNGEVDCWDLKCPLLPCANPIQDPGDCCPRCAAEICPSGNGTRTGEPCPYNGVKYESGAQFSDVNDPCSVCNCQVSDSRHYSAHLSHASRGRFATPVEQVRYGPPAHASVLIHQLINRLIY